ncbi:protein of unknown function [Trichlorobacter ammonificans]|uniref:Uncharacterized protein n=1 Tax=Trichlorobacter ammonificans TaxID=2916410 RepID=A0ABN8HHB6_9BACT|nr:protein of unknown function [Trichlorobacter ammonificans]
MCNRHGGGEVRARRGVPSCLCPSWLVQAEIRGKKCLTMLVECNTLATFVYSIPDVFQAK